MGRCNYDGFIWWQWCFFIGVCVCLCEVPEPCLDSFVFLRVKEKQENILVEPETDEQR